MVCARTHESSLVASSSKLMLSCADFSYTPMFKPFHPFSDSATVGESCLQYDRLHGDESERIESDV